MAHDPYHTRYYREGRLFSEVCHEDSLGKCVPVLDAATGGPVNFERKAAALKRCLRTMSAMDQHYAPGILKIWLS